MPKGQRTLASCIKYCLTKICCSIGSSVPSISNKIASYFIIWLLLSYLQSPGVTASDFCPQHHYKIKNLFLKLFFQYIRKFFCYRFWQFISIITFERLMNVLQITKHRQNYLRQWILWSNGIQVLYRFYTGFIKQHNESFIDKKSRKSYDNMRE